MLEEIKQVLRQEAEAIQNIPVTDAYEKAISIIEERVHHLKGKLVASGMGKAGQIALNIATTFSSTGTPAVLLLISNSGRTREILELVELAENLHKNLPLIVITSNKESQLAQMSDVCLETGNPKEVCILGLTPSTSTTVMTVIGDVLVVMMMKHIGFTNEDYAKRHHGGYLGAQSRLQAGMKK